MTLQEIQAAIEQLPRNDRALLRTHLLACYDDEGNRFHGYVQIPKDESRA